MRRTFVAGTHHLLHAPRGPRTYCGRAVDRVNCEPTLAAFIVGLGHEGHCRTCTRLIKAEIAAGGDVALAHHRVGAAQ